LVGRLASSILFVSFVWLKVKSQRMSLEGSGICGWSTAATLAADLPKPKRKQNGMNLADKSSKVI